MKNFKATAKFLPFLFMLFAMGSCKKNSSDPGLDENAQINQVTASDLENYYR